jgi:hypothetical protein
MIEDELILEEVMFDDVPFNFMDSLNSPLLQAGAFQNPNFAFRIWIIP